MEGHYYVVSSVIHDEEKTYRKHFASRERANRFVYHLLSEYNLQIEDIRRIAKHVVENYCEDHQSRIFVSRV